MLPNPGPFGVCFEHILVDSLALVLEGAVVRSSVTDFLSFILGLR